MDFPAQAHPHPHGGWPGNELEEVLSASLGVPSAGGRIVEVLGRSFLWIPLPNGGGPHSGPLDLPTLEIEGQAYVPVFSSEEQLRQVAGAQMAYTIAPAVEFARGLPPQVDWQDDPVDFLAAASAEFAATGVVRTARRCMAAIETADPVMFVGVELAHWEGDARALPLDALGRALAKAPLKTQVNLVLLEAAQDPVCDWMRTNVRPFYDRDL